MLAEGAVVNRKYKIQADLGHGALGRSYKVLVLGSGRVSVIKLLDQSLVPSHVPLDLVERAVLKSCELHHSAAIPWQSLEAGDDRGVILVRDFVEAVSLQRALPDGKPWPVRRAIHVIRQIALVLDAAHQIGIVHGDLRPEKILLSDPEGGEHAGVLDFGLMRLRENFTYSLHKLVLKNPGPLMGNPHYVSPEQAAGLHGDGLDSRCDIYSLGIIFCQLLTGHLPSPADPPLGSLLWSLLEAAPDLNALYPELRIHKDLIDLIQLMLAKPRAKRIESAGKVIERLDAFERLDSLARAKAQEVPSFSLLTNTRRSKLASKKLEPAAPKRQPVARVNPPAEAETPTSKTEVPSPIRAVGAVEIASLQPQHPATSQAIRSPQLSRWRWGIAAAVLIVVIGLGAAGYHLRGRILWTEAASVSHARLHTWGHRLDTALQTSSGRVKSGFEAWSQKVKTQLSSRASVPAASASPQRSAARRATAAHGPPASAATSTAALPSPVPAARAAAAAAPAPAPSTTTTPAPSPETAGAATNPSNRAASFNTPAHLAGLRPQVEKATVTAQNPPPRAQPDTAAIARLVSADTTRGDSLFELGDYDQAISDYRRGLALDPGNRDLLDRIARAKKAKAAEAEYLNQ